MSAPGKGTSGRRQRIESQMQRVLAELIAREVKDPRIGPVTITQVALVPDMSLARVYFVPFGMVGLGTPDPGAATETGTRRNDELLRGLNAAAGFLRGEVGRRVGLRHAPRLEFVVDDSFDRAARLSALMGSGDKPRG